MIGRALSYSQATRAADRPSTLALLHLSEIGSHQHRRDAQVDHPDSSRNRRSRGGLTVALKAGQEIGTGGAVFGESLVGGGRVDPLS